MTPWYLHLKVCSGHWIKHRASGAIRNNVYVNQINLQIPVHFSYLDDRQKQAFSSCAEKWLWSDGEGLGQSSHLVVVQYSFCLSTFLPDCTWSRPTAPSTHTHASQEKQTPPFSSCACVCLCACSYVCIAAFGWMCARVCATRVNAGCLHPSFST